MSITDKLITGLILFYPALLLGIHGGMNAAFILMLIVTGIALFQLEKPRFHCGTECRWFSLAMASPVIAIALSQAAHHEFRAADYDWAARFLFSIPIYLSLRSIHLGIKRPLQAGILIGVSTSSIILMLHPYNWDNHLTTGTFVNLIHFSDLVIMLGFLCLYSIDLTQSEPKPWRIMKLTGFLAAIYMSMQTGERGAWLSIPVLVLIWASAQGGQHVWRRLFIATASLVIAALLIYLTVDKVHDRINMVYQDWLDYGNGHLDTSLGIRLQLWGAAIRLFLEHPLFGVGLQGFAQIMPSLAEQGVITPLAAKLGQGEVHNEILAKCAELGIFGLLSILAVLFVPLGIFLKIIKGSSGFRRQASLMGIAMTVSFFIFGLTVEIFNLKMTAAFYALTLAILMAAATRHEDA